MACRTLVPRPGVEGVVAPAVYLQGIPLVVGILRVTLYSLL